MAHFYMIGIGGAGMSVIAELFIAQGHRVSGSDREESANTQTLRNLGAAIYIGHAAENVPADAIVVVSSAIKEMNPELACARLRGQQILHRSQALALAAGNRDFVAVAGAHGKTSTSAMLAVALEHLGLDPSRAIGGTLVVGGAGGYCGSGSIFIAEADESDASFLNYTPRVEIVTNVEPDHLDHYGSRENFEQAFVDFAHCLVPHGVLIACADDSGSHALARQAAADGIRVIMYGRAAQEESMAAAGIEYARLSDVLPREGASASGTIAFRGAQYPLDLSVPGEHMLLNAVGAWLAGVDLGVDACDMARALRAFRGASRRFELVGTSHGVRVIDDYAHHPTEIAATLITARCASRGAVRVLFQPHLYSRTQNFAQEFAQALSAADDVIITGVYAAREVPSDGAEGDAIAELMVGVPFIADMHEAARELARHAQPGDLLMTVGAGSVTAMGSVILDELNAHCALDEQ